MADVAVIFSEAQQTFDWPDNTTLSATQLNSNQDLHTSVYLSLFTDRVAPLEYDGEIRGCWTDTFDDDLIGSRLWMLARSTTAGALQRAKDYCDEALAWMLEDKVADHIDVTTFWQSSTTLGIYIQVFQPMRRAPEEFHFSYMWKGN